MILQTNLLGDDVMVAARLRAYRDAGVSTLKVQPTGDTLQKKLDTLGRAMDLLP